LLLCRFAAFFRLFASSLRFPMLRWITIVLAIAGITIAVYAALTTKQETPVLPLSRQASVNPFASGIAALGIVEPSGRDVAIVAPEQAIVTSVFVDVNDEVKQGQALFELDSRLLQADLVRAQAAVEAGRAELTRWAALPRAEDVPPLEAAVARARAQLADRAEQLRLTEQAKEVGANNERDVSIAKFARDAAQAELDRTNAELARLKAGGWQPDKLVLEAQLRQREAEVRSLQLRVERLTVRAPRDGRILRRTIEAGESASFDQGRPALILGDLRNLRVRAQIDEEDIALLAPLLKDAGKQQALARTRGAIVIDVPLRLVRVEPFARPKADITGANTERVDTRVIDVVFEMTQEPRFPIFPGQALDVFIEASSDQNREQNKEQNAAQNNSANQVEGQK
jgi:multidrug efflux pump subunit AcrA (membrane-fusion protein)